jgi:uncharacterized protein YodC (DUF2158 family)
MFKIGDVVQLKGGSPVMTVIGTRKDLHGNDEVTVVWFDDTDKAQTAEYPPEALKVYEDEVPGIPDEDD